MKCSRTELAIGLEREFSASHPRHPSRNDRRQLRHRGGVPGAPAPVVRRRSVRLPRMRDDDRRLRQRPGPLLAHAARPLSELRHAHLGTLSAHRARDGHPLRHLGAGPGYRRPGRAGLGPRSVRPACHGHAHRPRAARDSKRCASCRRSDRRGDRRDQRPGQPRGARDRRGRCGRRPLPDRPRLPAWNGNGRCEVGRRSWGCISAAPLLRPC